MAAFTQSPATAAAIFGAPETGGHADSLFSIDASSAVSAQHYDTKTGFGEPCGIGSAPVPAPAISAVAGSFTAPGSAQILVTGGDGSTLITPAAADPADGAAAPPHLSPPFDQVPASSSPRMPTRSSGEAVASL
ncbi:MAG: hypothetical protein AUG49_15665 [Catenulispora sp. 13_1_20CM_3_70_7]|nr:MAG: hypothetical protein AUG49_15665 [Catenulispora sp. 13_1_20CM_3_70_7]